VVIYSAEYTVFLDNSEQLLFEAQHPTVVKIPAVKNENFALVLCPGVCRVIIDLDFLKGRRSLEKGF
jgi:hypothetical protein